MADNSIPADIQFMSWAESTGEDQQAIVSKALADFILSAKSSVRMAIYDFRLHGQASDTVLGAIRKAAANGVEVMIGYDAGKTPDTQEQFASQGGDPAPSGNAEYVSQLDGVSNIATKAINAGHQLMHSKYVVVDAFTQQGAVWMGSANFTNDAWSLQENNVLRACLRS